MVNNNSKRHKNILFYNDCPNIKEIDSYSADYRLNDAKTLLPDYNYQKRSSKKFRKASESISDVDGLPKIHTHEEEKKFTHKTKRKAGKHYCVKVRRPSIFKATISLMLCIAGTLVLINSINIDTFDALYEDNFNDFLLPVVMNDPNPFESIEELNFDKILSSSVWHTVLSQEDRHYTDFDELGRVIIPVEDVSKSASILFGSTYSMPIKNPEAKTFFELDSNNENYLVKPISSQESYFPTVISKVRIKDGIILDVGYLRPYDPFLSSVDHDEAPSPDKIMKYTLKRDKLNGKLYINSIQTPTD